MNKVTEGKYVGEWEKRNQLQHTTVHSDSKIVNNSLVEFYLEYKRKLKWLK